jgi:hypothetical protein
LEAGFDATVTLKMKEGNGITYPQGDVWSRISRAEMGRKRLGLLLGLLPIRTGRPDQIAAADELARDRLRRRPMSHMGEIRNETQRILIILRIQGIVKKRGGSSAALIGSSSRPGLCEPETNKEI